MEETPFESCLLASGCPGFPELCDNLTVAVKDQRREKLDAGVGFDRSRLLSALDDLREITYDGDEVRLAVLRQDAAQIYVAICTSLHSSPATALLRHPVM